MDCILCSSCTEMCCVLWGKVWQVSEWPRLNNAAAVVLAVYVSVCSALYGHMYVALCFFTTLITSSKLSRLPNPFPFAFPHSTVLLALLRASDGVDPTEPLVGGSLKQGKPAGGAIHTLYMMLVRACAVGCSKRVCLRVHACLMSICSHEEYIRCSVTGLVQT